MTKSKYAVKGLAMPRKKNDYSTWNKEALIERIRQLEKRKKYVPSNLDFACAKSKVKN